MYPYFCVKSNNKHLRFFSRELSIKEELFMKQQGESTSTVDRVRSLQEDLQKSR